MQLIFYLIGGLGFFFFGMQVMSDGLKKIAGTRLKNILHMMTRIPLMGIMVGAAVTCFIQSSSATSVMVIGFVNAGLLALRQAISVIIGANIGTTFTAWLVSSMSVFNITQYALPAVGIGVIVNALGKTRNSKSLGQIIMGFGMLFIGLGFMKDAFAPLQQSQHIKQLFLSFGSDPLLGVVVGMAFTMLLQSSSATIAVIQVMAFNGLISFPAAIPLILGGDIGTTITAQLAAIGTNRNARRAAMSHTLFNVVGVAYMLIFVYTGWFVRFIDFIIPGSVTLKNIMFYIAVANSVFKVANAVIFLPFLSFLEKMSVMLVPTRKGAIEPGAQYLERHLLDTPPIALEQARRESVRMLELASRSVSLAVKAFLEKNIKVIRRVNEIEDAVDNLQSEITHYLIELSQRNLSEEQSESLPVLLHSVNDIERIGDHAENIVESLERRVDENLPFTDEACGELSGMWDELHRMMIETRQSFQQNDLDLAQSVLQREERINRLQTDLKKAHVNRLNNGQCNLKSGIVFLDLVDNFEKIGDHLTNIAQGVLSEMRWTTHKKEKDRREEVFS